MVYSIIFVELVIHVPLLRSHAFEGKWKGTESEILKAVYLVCDEIKSIFSLYGQLRILI